MENDIETLQEILKGDPANFQARRELSIKLLNKGFNEEAEGNLLYLLKFFPEDVDLLYNLGIVSEKLKKFEEAKTYYEKAIKISPQEDFYYNLGEVLVELKDWHAAMDSFKKVLETDSKDGNAYFNLGLCYLNMDEKNLATDNFQKAVSLNPKDIFAFFYLGNIYQKDGLTNFATECYNKVLEISPDYSWAYFNLASIAFENNNLDDAKSYLLKTIFYNSQDTEAYKLLTQICLKQGETEEILEILHTRLEKEENGDLFYCLARVYKYIGQLEEYCKNLEKALKNPYTLKFDKNIIKQEYDYMNLKLNNNQSIDTEMEISDYSQDNDSENESSVDDSGEEYDVDYDADEVDEDDEENFEYDDDIDSDNDFSEDSDEESEEFSDEEYEEEYSEEETNL